MVLDQSTVTFQKGWGSGVITICVVLDQSTVIFQKGGGKYYNLCGIRSKSWQCYVLSVGC